VDDGTHTLTTAIASGNTEAFARLYEAWFDTMYAEAKRTTGRDEAFCLDIVHDAMIRVIRSMKPLDHEGALVVWLRRAVRSCAYDRLKQESRRRAREHAAPPAETAEMCDDLDDRLAWLRSELNAMDRASSMIITMRHRFGWTLRQIGTTLGLKTGAVDRRLRSVESALQQRAAEVFDE
jgi:RNA polymerase sigma factor (sigma-70 family)